MAARQLQLRIPLVIAIGLGLLVLTVFALLPSLVTGYWGEDTYYSTIVTGGLVLNGHTWTQELLEYEKHNIQLGRFYPLTPVIINCVFTLIQEVVYYKAYLIAVTGLDVLLFFLLVRRLGGAKGFAGLAGCLAISLFQFRIYIDPLLGYYGQIQLMTAAVFGSLLALQLFLEGRGRRWMVVSALAYLAASLIYEVAYTLVLLHLWLILKNGGEWKARVIRSLPFIAVVGSCGAMSFLTRRLYPNNLYLQNPKLDPKAALLALAQQTTAALPLNYYANDPLHIFSNLNIFTSIQSGLIGPQLALVSLLALALSYASLRSGLTATGGPSFRWRLMVMIGLMLAILPAVLIAISPYHQNYLTFGVGWIPVMTQYFGVALLLASAIWGAVGSNVGGAFTRGKCLAASCLVASLVGVTFLSNVEVSRCFSAPTGSARFRDFAGGHGASWHLPRLNMEAALKAGLMDEVPATSTVQVANTYPYWNDVVYGPFFYAKHTSKALTLVTPSTPVTASKRIFKVRDLFVDQRTGFVLLSEVVADLSLPNGRSLRLFIRSPELDREVATLQISTVGSGTVALRDLPLLRSGSDWALYSLESEASKVNPDVLQVVDQAHGTAWQTYGQGRVIAATKNPTAVR